MSNRSVKLQMLQIYKTVDIDWLNYKVTRDNVMTYHHIKKKCKSGPCSRENGALLTEFAQRYLHGKVERNDPKYFIYLNELLQEINNLGWQEYKSGILVKKRVIINDNIVVYE